MNNAINRREKCFMWAVISVGFLLIFSPNTSPLTSWHGADSSFFILVGKGIKNGMLPYRDFFDMKGPYLFEIEHIGQLIADGRMGAFVIQCLNLFFCLLVIDKIFCLEKKEISWKNWVSDLILFVFPCLIFTSYSLDGGNFTEEFSLPFLFVALMFCISYVQEVEKNKEKEHSLILGGYYGFTFGVLTFIRITNAALLGAILITITLDLIFRKKYRNLFLNGIVFLIGCIIAIAPACIYYAQQGFLEEMLKQMFLFGIQYSSGEKIINKFVYLLEEYGNVLITMALPMAVLAMFKIKNWKYWVLSISSYGCILLAILLGNVYRHYFTLAVPHMVLGCVFLNKGRNIFLKKSKINKVITVTVILCFFMVMYRNILSNSWNCVEKILGKGNNSTEVLEIMEVIPENEHKNIYVYDVESCSRWYMRADILPMHRYCDWQKAYIELNPEIGYELSAWIKKESPKWIVTTADHLMEPQIIAQVVESNYKVYFENDLYVLYLNNDFID